MAKIETIAAEKLRAVTGGFLGFGGAGNRFPVVRNLWQRFNGAAGGGGAAGAAGGTVGGCPTGGCPGQ
jgi:hypothetical protein